MIRAYRFHLRGREFPLDRGVLIALLHLHELVALQSANGLHLPAVRRLFFEFLAELEFYLGVFEGAGRLQGIRPVILRQFDDGTDATAHLPRHQTHP